MCADWKQEIGKERHKKLSLKEKTIARSAQILTDDPALLAAPLIGRIVGTVLGENHRLAIESLGNKMDS